MDYNSLLENSKLALDLVGGGTDIATKLRELLKRGNKGGEMSPEVAELTLELQNQLINAQRAQLSILDSLIELKKEVMEADRQLELQRSYEPFATAGGAIVLALKPNEDGNQPVHYICPDCADDGKRRILQPQGTGKRCNPCEKFFPFDAPDDRPVRRPVRDDWIR
ncbi:hypothetical protein [Oceaniglobus trochenteri]|uniref:hypothetical protein n=1 Tax=Oceaniglobus trochenteri TaxID=2763260 RepID=UPI001CFFDC9C|nr:hypothetical protein [Oceaniglobus trochenteri]